MIEKIIRAALFSFIEYNNKICTTFYYELTHILLIEL